MNWPSNFYSAATPILPYIFQCAPAPASQCFWDNYTITGRVLNYTVTLESPHNSREWCAHACVAAGYAWAGVEFGVACFCGAALPVNGSLPPSACAAMPCAGAPQEACGGADIISVFPSTCPDAPGVPPGLLPSKAYQGAPRMWLTAPRTTVGATEGAVAVEVAVLAATQPDEVTAVWWTVPGDGKNTSVPLAPTGDSSSRGVWAVALPLPADASAALEYVVISTWGGGAQQITVPIEGAQVVIVV